LEVFLNALLIVAGFILLIKGGDFLVEGASSLARRYQLPEMMIGLTIVAFVTSSPELVVNLFSGVNGYDEVVFGSIIGSNIFNLFLILGLAGLIHPMSVQFNTVWKEIPYNIMVTIVLFLLENDELIFGVNYNYAGNWDGLILLSFFGFFIYYVIKYHKKEVVDLDEIKVHSNRKSITMVAGGMLALTFGGRLDIYNPVDT
jgi:cation:H+ antiporter